MRQKRLIGVVEAVNSSNETIPQPIGCAVSQKPVALASSDRLKRLEMAIETLVPSQKGFESPFFSLSAVLISNDLSLNFNCCVKCCLIGIHPIFSG